MMELELPWPPSLNHYWRQTRGRIYLSDAGRRYREDAIAAILAQLGAMPEPITEQVSVALWFQPPSMHRRDLDNLCKPVLDALQHGKVLLDDSQVVKLFAAWGKVEAPGCARARILTLDAERHPLAECRDLLRELEESDRRIADRYHRAAAGKVMLGSLHQLQRAVERWQEVVASGQYSALAD